MNDKLTYATDEMRAAQGRWGGIRTAPPITETDIRRWAMATCYPKQPPTGAVPAVPTVRGAGSGVAC